MCLLYIFQATTPDLHQYLQMILTKMAPAKATVCVYWGIILGNMFDMHRAEDDTGSLILTQIVKLYVIHIHCSD